MSNSQNASSEESKEAKTIEVCPDEEMKIEKLDGLKDVNWTQVPPEILSTGSSQQLSQDGAGFVYVG